MPILKLQTKSQLQTLARLVRHEIMYLTGRKSNVDEYPKTDTDFIESMRRWNDCIDSKNAEMNELLELIEQEIKP